VIAERYFEHTRPEVRALVPQTARRVLDVGCGGGGLGAALKADLGCEVVGIEGFPEAAERARGRLDDVLCLDLDALESLPPELGGFDAIVFGDVLEHLREPKRLVRTLLPALADDGVVVCSIPNVRHWSVLYALLVEDRWTYDDCGLLDRTHVHFFTLGELAAMLGELGLAVLEHDVVKHVPPVNPVQPLAELAATLGGDRAEAAAALAAYQYVLVARRAPAVSRPPVAAARVTSADPRALEVDLDQVADPAEFLRAAIPNLAGDDALVLKVSNVKHWSVLVPLLVHDRWENGPLRYFTLEAVSNLLDEVGLEGVDVVPDESAPLPSHLTPLLDLAAAAGAEREETRLRLGARGYVITTQLSRAAAD
jgi:2-polyprenyl-3-methyl-5-hydroxy-6-metoxy-1,4-benzoquinol methylase